MTASSSLLVRTERGSRVPLLCVILVRLPRPSAAGIEVMIDARELPPPWARAKNDSGGGEKERGAGVDGWGHGIAPMRTADNPPPPRPHLLSHISAWSEIPGPAHYEDYVRWLGVMLARYAPIATSVEVSNENDGCECPLPLNGVPQQHPLAAVTPAPPPLHTKMQRPRALQMPTLQATLSR